MKKIAGLLILFFSFGLAMPAKAQSAAGTVLKVKTEEVREKIKEITKTKAAEKQKTVKVAPAKTANSSVQKWGTTAKSTAAGSSNTKGQLAVPSHPTPVWDEQKKYVPVDTSGT